MTSILAAGLVASTPRAEAPPAPDPLEAYPDNYEVLIENALVRVLDFRLAAGASEDFHRHPANVAVFLGEFRIHFTFPDGRSAVRAARPGDVAFSESVVHASRNVGDTDAHGILIELKPPLGSAAH
jgi:quercetin dioxygenase-like cupin family protein